LDYITRKLVRDGELQQLIAHDGLRGMTSNPTIFQQAIAAGDQYDQQIQDLVHTGASAEEIFQAIAVRDIQDACDLFVPVYQESKGADGYVSIEVSPGLAHSTDATIAEGRRLWELVGRPNVMIKVPGTAEGAPAVEQLLSEGINVNVTLLFSLENHERVMWNYVKALENRVQAGQPIDHLASVASFFVSRVDTLVDKLLEERTAQAEGDQALQAQLRALLGTAAIANAKLAYARFQEIFGGERFAALQKHGAHVQRVLWASTSTKNPAYRDVRYVEELIGPHTVNTMPMQTLRATQDHAVVQRTIDSDVGQAQKVFEALEALGISYAAVTKQLEDEGVASFEKSFNTLIAGVEEKRQQLQHAG